jgi:ABC-2 type transport system permease protein
MMGTPAAGGVSAIRAVWLLTQLRLRRFANMLTVRYNRRLGGAKGRPATAGKKRNRWVVSGVVGVFMLFAYGNIARQSFINLHRQLDHVGRALGVMPAGVFSDALTRGLAMEFSLLLIVVILASLATRELSQPDWDLEWLVTLPLGRTQMLWSRVIERSIANPIGLLTLLPAGTILAWVSGYRWSAPLVGIAAAYPLLLLASIARTLVDTGLRMSLSASRLRNLQAVLSIVSVLLLYIAVSLGLQSSPLAFVLEWARQFPAWASWLPPGVVIRSVNAPDLPAQLQMAALLFVEVGIMSWAGLALLSYQLRNGVVASSSRETGRRAVRAREPAAATAVGTPLLLGTVVQRRELRLLSRDRSFLVQTLVLPLVIVFSQLIFQGRLYGASLSGLSSTTVAAIAFGIASYTLMMSAFQTLNSEGGSLWLLFTVPRSLESILAEKARLWAVLALAYPSAVFITAAAIKRQVDIELIGLGAVVLLGVPIYTVIAVSLGVFGCDPLAQEAGAKVRPTFVYLYMMLAGLYTYALFASQWWQRIVLIVLSSLLAAALWQKARDELPFLLDPAASPPARVSTSDGAIAAMIFFVVQGICGAIYMAATQHISGGALITCYSIGGAVTYGLFRLSFWRAKTQGVPAVFGAGVQKALGWGVAAGTIAAVGGVSYQYLLQRFDLLQDLAHDSANGIADRFWIPILAIVAAPIFEEFIFRGLIFGGLRRSWRVAPAVVASAAVFAIVHPPLSMIPVFCLGLCTAFAYERSKMLLAPMIAHAIYNAVVLAFQNFS